MNDNKILQEYEQIRGQKGITEIECVRKIKEKKVPFFLFIEIFLIFFFRRIYISILVIFFPYSSSLIFIGILCHKKKKENN